jgi:O-antigen/teichoic acid export membrane protein
MLFKLLSRLLSLISIIILARLLVPEDFGIVALASATVAGLELFVSFRLDVALIQNQQATQDHYDSAFTINFAFQLFVAFVLLMLAKPAASLYGEPALRQVLYALATVPVLHGLQNIRTVDFRKEMRFGKDFALMLSQKLIGFSITVPLAFLWRNHWALVAGFIGGTAGGVVAGYILLPHRPRLSLKYCGELFAFSKWLFLNSWLYFLRNKAASFIIGKVSGLSAVGLFEVSYEIANFSTTELIAPINRAVFPGIAKVAHDARSLQNTYLSVIGMISMLALPAGTGIAAIAEPLVWTLLGQNWIGAVPIISILALAGAIMCIETNTGTVCVALGRPDLLTKLYTFAVALLLILLVILINLWGQMGAAAAFLILALVSTPVYLIVVSRLLKLRIRQLADVLWRPVGSCFIMYFSLREFLKNNAQDWSIGSALPTLLSSISIGLIVYSVSIGLLWLCCGRPRGAESTVISEIGGLVGRVRNRFA